MKQTHVLQNVKQNVKRFYFWTVKHRSLMAVCLLMTFSVVLMPGICSAEEISDIGSIQSDMPWNTGFKLFGYEVTGPLTKLIGTIVVACGFLAMAAGVGGPMLATIARWVLGIAGAGASVKLVGKILSGANGLNF